MYNMHILFNHGNFGFLDEKKNLLTFFANVLRRTLVRVKGRRKGLPCFFLLISTHAERSEGSKMLFS